MEVNYPLRKNSYENELGDDFYSIVDSCMTDYNDYINENKAVKERKIQSNEFLSNVDGASSDTGKQTSALPNKNKFNPMTVVTAVLLTASIIFSLYNYVGFSMLTKEMKSIEKKNADIYTLLNSKSIDDLSDSSSISATESEVLSEKNDDNDSIDEDLSTSESLKKDIESELKYMSLHLTIITSSQMMQIIEMPYNKTDNNEESQNYSIDEYSDYPGIQTDDENSSENFVYDSITTW